MSYTTAQIAQHVNGELLGSGDIVILGIGQIDAATAEQISYIRDEAYLANWKKSKAGAVLVARTLTLDSESLVGRVAIRVPDPDLALNIILDLFAPPKIGPTVGIHPTATVHPEAILGQGVSVGPNCVIGAKVRIGDRAILHASVVILDETTVGDDVEFYPGVIIRERCVVGSRVIIHPNAVIGADGFGYRPSTDPKRPGLIKIPHIGNVIIGDDVEIGACSCIDRAKFASTIIGMGTKIDNLVQIAHNCRIGRFCILAGEVGLAGSVTLGDGVILGGKAAIKDHCIIGSGARVAACGAVMDNIPAGETWGGYPAREVRTAFREYAAMKKLPELLKSLKRK